MDEEKNAFASFEQSESSLRCVHAASDLVELLKLAHSAAHRALSEARGEAYDVASSTSRQLHAVRQLADGLLRAAIEQAEGSQLREPRGADAIRQSKLG